MLSVAAAKIVRRKPFFSFAGENPNSLRKTRQLHRKAPADIFELED